MGWLVNDAVSSDGNVLKGAKAKTMGGAPVRVEYGEPLDIGTPLLIGRGTYYVQGAERIGDRWEMALGVNPPQPPVTVDE